MAAAKFDVVTGAFGFTGRHIARRLLARGGNVRTLTRRAEPGEFGGRITAFPLNFDDMTGLEDSLRGAGVLYNTYWVRFPRGGTTFDDAAANIARLVGAAKRAGVQRIVHVSVANPSHDSRFAYFRGKARAERAVVQSGLSYAIIRPTVLFGPEDILINNIAWLLRNVPVFGIAGSGRYRIQPVYVDDVASLAVRLGSGTSDVTVDAVGPETFSYNDLVALIAATTGSRARIIHVPAAAAWAVAKVAGAVLNDVLLTWQELGALMADLLISHDPPTCGTRLSAWLAERAGSVGRHYHSELERHFGCGRGSGRTGDAI